jgi:hypothetical protein
MKNQKKVSSHRVARVEKVLLQMAPNEGDWAGKATVFDGPAEFHFYCLADLFDWLKKRAEKLT